MKRREFGLLSSAGFLAAGLENATAQTAPDAALLQTTLTPMGAERAGNADGSIPAWTGGMVAPPGGPVEIMVFTDEKPLYSVNAGNMAQYQNLLTPGIQFMITKFGFNLNVFQTHRTAAAPQYVYDNTALNVTRAKLNPNGGRLGVIGAYGGVPFPIINTSDSLSGGAQLIWNHLLAWEGFSFSNPFGQAIVVTGGQRVLAEGNANRFRCPYYDPKGSPETFQGYFFKTHLYFKAPPSFNGQELITWHSINVEQQPDIVWELLNGQGRVRKAPDEAYDAPNPYSDALANDDESNCFYGNPSQYDWHYVGKQEMLVPYHCNAIRFKTADEVFGPKFPNPDIVRWEKHRVWVVDATLHPGERNVLKRRRFYIDEDSWFALLGESYDANDNMVKTYFNYNRVAPVIPATAEQGYLVFNVQSGDYAYNGTLEQPPYSGPEVIQEIPESFFEPQEMSANASF